MLAKYMTRNDARMDEFGATLMNVQTSIKNLENQERQLARTNIERSQGSLQSNTEANLGEHLKVISLCSGKTIEERTAHGPSTEMKRTNVEEGPSASQEPIKKDEHRGEKKSRDPSPA